MSTSVLIEKVKSVAVKLRDDLIAEIIYAPSSQHKKMKESYNVRLENMITTAIEEVVFEINSSKEARHAAWGLIDKIYAQYSAAV